MQIPSSDYIDELKKFFKHILYDKAVKANFNTYHKLAVKLSPKIYVTEKKISALEIQIEERKNVDRTRGILMKKFNMSEDSAYKNIRKKP